MNGRSSEARSLPLCAHTRSFQTLTDDLESGRSFSRSRTAVIGRRAAFPLRSYDTKPTSVGGKRLRRFDCSLIGFLRGQSGVPSTHP